MAERGPGVAAASCCVCGLARGLASLGIARRGTLHLGIGRRPCVARAGGLGMVAPRGGGCGGGLGEGVAGSRPRWLPSVSLSDVESQDE